MASSKLSLFYSLTLLLAILPFIISPVNANGLKRHRMIRKRQTDPSTSTDAGPLGIINPIVNPTAQSSTDSTTGSTPTGKTQGNNNNGKGNQPSDTADTDPSKQTADPSGGILDSLTSVLGIGGSKTDESTRNAAPTNTTTSSTTSTTGSTTSTSSSSSKTDTQTSNSQPTDNAPNTSVDVDHVTAQATQTVSSQSNDNSSSANLDDKSGATKKDSHNIIIILAAVGGGVVLILLLWTVFRKMKLGTSKEFDERLNPIDWQPTSVTDEPPMTQHQRSGSIRSQRSLNSQMNPNYGTAAAQRSMISDLPNHDFTAGPAGLAPGGYADLHRGPSPAPSDNASVRRGPSYNRGPSPYDRGPYGGYGGY